MADIIPTVITYADITGNTIKPSAYTESDLILLGIDQALVQLKLKCSGIDLVTAVPLMTPEQKAALKSYTLILSLNTLDSLDSGSGLVEISDGYTTEKFSPKDVDTTSGLNDLEETLLNKFIASMNLPTEMDVVQSIVVSDSHMKKCSPCKPENTV